MIENQNKSFILASSSPTRKQLLERLVLPFECISPNIDESRLSNELVEDFVVRLARSKAKKISTENPHALVVGCDEVVVNLDVDAQIHLGKPGNHEVAITYLQQASNCRLRFLSAMSVCYMGEERNFLANTYVQFKKLTADEIEYYLQSDKPYQCAGAFKSETLGVALCESIVEDEPGALMGLPLISLCKVLTEFGLSPLRA